MSRIDEFEIDSRQPTILQNRISHSVEWRVNSVEWLVLHIGKAESARFAAEWVPILAAEYITSA
eukprot:269256-Pleurochrysis_carterae.AAC.1